MINTQTQNLTQLVSQPTHIKGHILDLVLTNSPTHVSDCTVSTYRLSDHFIVNFSIRLMRPPTEKKQISFRRYAALDVDSFCEDLQSVQNIILNSDLSTCVEQYNTQLTAILDKQAPLTTRTILVHPDTNWYTEAVREAKRDRRRKERVFRKTGLEVHKMIYRDACLKVNLEIEKAKTNHYSLRVEECGGDQKKLFCVLDKIMHRGKSSSLPRHDDPTELAERFCQFYTDRIQGIRNQIESGKEDADPSEPVTTDGDNMIRPTFSSFTECRGEDLEKILTKMPSKTSSLDPVPVWLIKRSLPVLMPVLEHIINTSMATGQVPPGLKEGRITPVLKKTDLNTDTLKNYRPVTTLPFVAKALEKVVSSQLVSYLTENNLQDVAQSAYRQHHSTETALVKIHNDIAQAVDEGQCVLLVLLDLSAAFDTVDHSLLIRKLVSIGVQGTALKWFESYIKGRTYRVQVQGSTSSSQELKYGVPQGSILGPVLYTLYTSELGEVARHSFVEPHMYADDQQLYYAFQLKQMDAAYMCMEQCVGEIARWLKAKYLLLNDAKTEFLVIQSPYLRSVPTFPPLKVGSASIEPVDKAKNIGVTFDKYLIMDKHINSVCKSVFYHLRNISRICKFLNKDAVESLIHSLVTSRLDYANAVLYGVHDKHVAKLQSALNAAARVLTRTRKRDHISPVLKSLHWLPVKYRIHFKILLLTYKALHKQAPKYLSDLLVSRQITRTLRSSDKALLEEPTFRLQTFGSRTFSRCAPRMWNKLPESIKSAKTVQQFKVQLKAHLFQKAFM